MLSLPTRSRLNDAPRWVLPALTCTVDVTLLSDVVARSQPGALWQSVVLPLALALGCFGALLLRMRRPIGVFVALCIASACSALLLSYRPTLIVGASLASLVVRCSARVATLGLGLAFGTSLAWVANEARTSPQPLSATSVVMLVAAYWLLVLFVFAAASWWRSSAERVVVLERRRVQDAQAAVAAERQRVAHELHDIVSQAVSLMVLQAAGGKRVVHGQPTRAHEAFSAIEQSGRRAMEELRRMLLVLRRDGEALEGPTGAPSERPATAEIANLVATYRAAGLPIDLRSAGVPRHVDASVDRALTRVAQEALANIAKHDPSSSRVEVDLVWHDTAVEVRVENWSSGRSPQRRSPLSAGFGLLGLRERLALVGGTLDASITENGFALHATIAIPDCAGPPFAFEPVAST